MNDSVLEFWGMACPSCKRDEALIVQVVTYGRLCPDGLDVGGDTEWSSDSPCRCSACGWQGIAGDAEPEEMDDE